MNSFASVAAIVVLACAWTGAMPPPEIAQACAKESNIPESNIGKIFHEGPTTPTEKCFLGCVFTKDGVIVNGQFSKEAALKKAQEQMKDNADALKLATDSIEKCSSMVTATEACEAGTQLRACISQHAGQLLGGANSGR